MMTLQARSSAYPLPATDLLQESRANLELYAQQGGAKTLRSIIRDHGPNPRPAFSTHIHRHQRAVVYAVCGSIREQPAGQVTIHFNVSRCRGLVRRGPGEPE